MRHIIVVPYNPDWVTAFNLEASQLQWMLGDMVKIIHHVGSTAVPGLSAKPIIDIMLVVQNVQGLHAYYPAFVELGYEPRGENGIPGRRFFRKGGDANRSHHIHAYEADHPEVTRHLDFRDYLIAHPQMAAAYGELKSALAQKYPYDIENYVKGKEAFVKAVIELAQRWRQTEE